MNYRFLLSPNNQLPGTAEYDLSHFSARLLWHSLFDIAPKTEASLGDKASYLLREFLAYCEVNSVPLAWDRHIIFLKWLISKQHPVANEIAIRIELIAAIALFWANDHYHDGEFQRMVVFDRTTSTAVGAIRPAHFSKPIKIVRLGIENINSIIDKEFIYGVGENWSISNWRPF